MEVDQRIIFDEYRQVRADELFGLAQLLQDYDLSPDVSPIREAASQCRGEIKLASNAQPDAGKRYWGYEISDLQIKLPAQRHSRPRRTSAGDANGFLSVTVHEYVPDNMDDLAKSFDLVRRLDVDFYLDAYLDVAGNIESFRTAWHLDTHLYPGKTHSLHPKFHLQLGGERLDDCDQDIRALYMPEAPRIPAAPLDGLLAVDFILSHYHGSDWDVLRNDEPMYNRLKGPAVARYWHPYYQSIASLVSGQSVEGLVLVPGIEC